MTLINPQRGPFLSPAETFASSYFGRTQRMQQIRRNLRLLAQADLPVLLEGESGTGKDVLANLLHKQSNTKGRLLKLNCLAGEAVSSVLHGTLDPTQMETELSGVLRDGGTILLDGIHELSLPSQAKLLLILKRYAGTPASRPVRIVSTATLDVQQLIDVGLFRVDLLYRINAVKIVLPPLRERPEDIPGLISFYLEKYARETLRPRSYLSPETLQMMEGYFWPGNLRQLDNVVRNYVLLGAEDSITRELLGADNGPTQNWAVDQIDITKPVALKEITRQVTQDLERQIILKVLQANGWNRQKTAKWLQISYRSLLYKLSDFGATQELRPKVESMQVPALRVASY